MNILKYKGEFFEVLELYHDTEDINNSRIVVKLSEPQAERQNDFAKRYWQGKMEDYKTESIAIVDNYHYTIKDSFLMGKSVNFNDANANMCHGEITSYRLPNNFDCLSDKDKGIIKTMGNINKFNL